MYWLYLWITGTILLAFYEEDERACMRQLLEHEEDETQERNIRKEHRPLDYWKTSEMHSLLWQNIYESSSRSTTQTRCATAYPRRRRNFTHGTMDWLFISGMPIGASIHDSKLIHHRNKPQRDGHDSGGHFPHVPLTDMVRGWEPVPGVL